MKKVVVPVSEEEKVWETRDLDIDWFLDSGLLFEINRQYLHPFGVALTILIEPNTGKKTWGFKDMRSNPSGLVFDKAVAKKGMKKFMTFINGWGRKQMDKRTSELGQSVQYVERNND